MRSACTRLKQLETPPASTSLAPSQTPVPVPSPPPATESPPPSPPSDPDNCDLVGGVRIEGFSKPGNCDFAINYRCYKWKMEGYSWSETKQLEYLQLCMAQDCEQSLEPLDSQKDSRTEAGIPLSPGCRYVDQYGFCYIRNAAQMWCQANPTSGYCRSTGDRDMDTSFECLADKDCPNEEVEQQELADHDGGAGWAQAPLGNAQNSQTAWVPGTFRFFGRDGDRTIQNNNAVVKCKCMKDCTCRLTPTSWKCYCVDKEQTPVGSGSRQVSRVIRSSR